MYANLRVTLEDRPEPIAAWKVLTTDSEIVVHEDLNDGGGNYAEPGPVHRFALGELAKIEASF